jgi:hypothetical protein
VYSVRRPSRFFTCRMYLGGTFCIGDFLAIVRAAVSEAWNVRAEAVKGIYDVSSTCTLSHRYTSTSEH